MSVKNLIVTDTLAHFQNNIHCRNFCNRVWTICLSVNWEMIEYSRCDMHSEVATVQCSGMVLCVPIWIPQGKVRQETEAWKSGLCQHLCQNKVEKMCVCVCVDRKRERGTAV